MLLFAPAAGAAPLVAEVAPGVTVDSTRGVVTARGVAPADRNAPSPAIARVGARRAALLAARSQLLAAVKQLPAADGALGKVAPAARLAREVELAPVVDETFGTDGSVRLTVAVGTEALRQAIAGPRAAPLDEPPPAVWIIDAHDHAITPLLDLAIAHGADAFRGAIRYATAAPKGDHTVRVTVVGDRGLEIDGAPPPAGAVVVVVDVGSVTPTKIALAVLLVASSAAADPIVTYPSSGSAAADDGEARTRALDAAFAGAVTEAVADLAGKNAGAQAAAVDREIVKRARKFVASFAVTREGPKGDRFEIDVDVRVDQGKLSARLVELGVVLREPDAVRPDPPVVQRRRATVLYRVTGAGPLAATFGASARADVRGADALAAALERGGYAVVPASAAGPAPGEGGELPVDDAGARALAGDVGADAALVVGVAVGPIGPVRGVPLQAAPVRARLHLVDVKTDKVLREAAIATAAWGDGERTPIAAADAAATMIAARAFATAPAATASEPPALTASSGITVRVVGAGAWAAAGLIRADLARAPGVTGVGYAGVGRGAVALAVQGAAAEKVAGVARATPGFSARTRVEDGVVVVRLQ